jgi:hypothetical protein
MLQNVSRREKQMEQEDVGKERHKKGTPTTSDWFLQLW